MNLELFTWIHSGAGNQPIIDFLSVAAAEVTPYLIIACMAVFWFTADHQGRRVLLEAAAVVILGLLINQGITLFYFHPRPFMMDICKPLIPHGPETSFPSDHATLLFAASLTLLFRQRWRRQGLVLSILAIAGAWARVYTGLHFPFDIIGSFVVVLMGAAVMLSLRSLITPFYDWVIRIVDRMESLFIKKTHYRET